MNVKDIMRSPTVTISEDATLREAVALLSTTRVSGLPVINGEGDLVGIVTEHDIIKAVLPTYEDILATDTGLLAADLIESRTYAVRDNPIRSIMTRKVVTLEEEDSVLKAASAMILKKVKRLPVTRDGKPIGVVSRIDILEALMQGRL